MMTRLRMPPIALSIALIAACAGSGQRPDSGPETGTGIEAALESITADDMYARIAYLASDEMAGRDTPSPGLEMAAEYLVEAFESFGLEPAGEDGTYYQRYPLPFRALDTLAVHFGLTAADGSDLGLLEYGVDFFATQAIDREGRDMQHGDLVYLGRLAESGWPGDVELEGDVAIVEVPGAADREWRLGVASARRQAMQARVSGLLIVLDEAFPDAAIERFAELAGRPRRELVDPDEIPVFYVKRGAASELLGRAGFDLEAVVAGPDAAIRIDGARAHFSALPEVIDDARPPNVAAIFRGGDPDLRDTFVIFSAHMDHVGVGTADATGDSIYNGADDDASGTAALVEVAEAFAALPERPARSLLFLAVSGEEKGLLGSRHYSNHPTVPVDAIVANINVDMIARNAPDSIVVIGQEFSSLGELVRRVASDNPEIGLEVIPDPWPEERFFFRSDHFNFARLEIPAIFFFAGVHEDYHQPSDEIDKIDSDKAARVARLIFLTAHAIAEDAAPPRWSEAGLEEVRALTR